MPDVLAKIIAGSKPSAPADLDLTSFIIKRVFVRLRNDKWDVQVEMPYVFLPCNHRTPPNNGPQNHKDLDIAWVNLKSYISHPLNLRFLNRAYNSYCSLRFGGRFRTFSKQMKRSIIINLASLEDIRHCFFGERRNANVLALQIQDEKSLLSDNFSVYRVLMEFYNASYRFDTHSNLRFKETLLTLISEHIDSPRDEQRHDMLTRYLKVRASDFYYLLIMLCCRDEKKEDTKLISDYLKKYLNSIIQSDAAKTDNSLGQLFNALRLPQYHLVVRDSLEPIVNTDSFQKIDLDMQIFLRGYLVMSYQNNEMTKVTKQILSIYTKLKDLSGKGVTISPCVLNFVSVVFDGIFNKTPSEYEEKPNKIFIGNDYFNTRYIPVLKEDPTVYLHLLDFFQSHTDVAKETITRHRAMLHFLSGKYSKAEFELKNLGKSNDEGIQFILGQIYYNLEQFPKALTHFENALKSVDNGHVWYGLGATNMALKRFEIAATCYTKVLRWLLSHRNDVKEAMERNLASHIYFDLIISYIALCQKSNQDLPKWLKKATQSMNSYLKLSKSDSIPTKHLVELGRLQWKYGAPSEADRIYKIVKDDPNKCIDTELIQFSFDLGQYQDFYYWAKKNIQFDVDIFCKFLAVAGMFDSSEEIARLGEKLEPVFYSTPTELWEKSLGYYYELVSTAEVHADPDLITLFLGKIRTADSQSISLTLLRNVYFSIYMTLEENDATGIAILKEYQHILREFLKEYFLTIARMDNDKIAGNTGFQFRMKNTLFSEERTEIGHNIPSLRDYFDVYDIRIDYAPIIAKKDDSIASIVASDICKADIAIALSYFKSKNLKEALEYLSCAFENLRTLDKRSLELLTGMLAFFSKNKSATELIAKLKEHHNRPPSENAGTILKLFKQVRRFLLAKRNYIQKESSEFDSLSEVEPASPDTGQSVPENFESLGNKLFLTMKRLEMLSGATYVSKIMRTIYDGMQTASRLEKNSKPMPVYLFSEMVRQFALLFENVLRRLMTLHKVSVDVGAAHVLMPYWVSLKEKLPRSLSESADVTNVMQELDNIYNLSSYLEARFNSKSFSYIHEFEKIKEASVEKENQTSIFDEYFGKWEHYLSIFESLLNYIETQPSSERRKRALPVDPVVPTYEAKLTEHKSSQITFNLPLMNDNIYFPQLMHSYLCLKSVIDALDRGNIGRLEVKSLLRFSHLVLEQALRFLLAENKIQIPAGYDHDCNILLDQLLGNAPDTLRDLEKILKAHGMSRSSLMTILRESPNWYRFSKSISCLWNHNSFWDWFQGQNNRLFDYFSDLHSDEAKLFYEKDILSQIQSSKQICVTQMIDQANNSWKIVEALLEFNGNLAPEVPLNHLRK